MRPAVSLNAFGKQLSGGRQPTLVALQVWHVAALAQAGHLGPAGFLGTQPAMKP
jgi:hypothetical protein